MRHSNTYEPHFAAGNRITWHERASELAARKLLGEGPFTVVGTEDILPEVQTVVGHDQLVSIGIREHVSGILYTFDRRENDWSPKGPSTDPKEMVRHYPKFLGSYFKHAA